MKYIRLILSVYPCGIVVIHCPTAVCCNIIKMTSVSDIVLIHYIISDISATFTFSRKKSDKFKFPVISIIFTAVFHKIPYTVCDAYKLITKFFCVVNSVTFTAEFHIPKIFFGVIHIGQTIR